jgi:hypothetical protein
VAVQVSVGALGVPSARKPKVVEAEGWSEPLYEALATDADDPLAVRVPFQTWVTRWPEPSVHRTVQPLTGALPAVTFTSPWKPPDHELTVV